MQYKEYAWANLVRNQIKGYKEQLMELERICLMYPYLNLKTMIYYLGMEIWNENRKAATRECGD